MPALPDPPPPGDWDSLVALAATQSDRELDITNLKSGDILQVATTHTLYTLRINGPREALLSTNRNDRPHGPVRLIGCTFGLSSSIKPDHLFCGGNMEFTHDEGRQTCNTTAIRGLQLVRRRTAPPPPWTIST